MYSVIFSEESAKQMAKLDNSVSSTIYTWVRKNLDGTTNPRAHGKGLTGNLKGFWRYRVGKYRLIAEIRDSEIIIEIVNVGHRANVYDS